MACFGVGVRDMVWCRRGKKCSAKNANRLLLLERSGVITTLGPRARTPLPLYCKGESQESVTKHDLRHGALAHLQDPKVGTHRGPECLARLEVLSKTMKEACRQLRRIKVRRSVVRHHSHGRTGGSVCVERPADVIEAWEFAVWDKAWEC